MNEYHDKSDRRSCAVLVQGVEFDLTEWLSLGCSGRSMPPSLTHIDTLQPQQRIQVSLPQYIVLKFELDL